MKLKCKSLIIAFKKMKQNIGKSFMVATGALAAIMALCFAVLAWTEPSAVPPEGNVAAPINTSVNSQIKAGDLGFQNDTNNPYYIHMDGASFSLKDGGGNIRFIMDQDGHAGLGVAVPSKNLEVAGDAKAGKFCLGDQCCSTWEECKAFVGGGGEMIRRVPQGCGTTAAECCQSGECFLTKSIPPYGSTDAFCATDGYVVAWWSSALSVSSVEVCRGGAWFVAGGERFCNAILGKNCDKGTCYYSGESLHPDNGRCMVVACNFNSDCTDVLGVCNPLPGPMGCKYQCDNELCCKNTEHNVAGRCVAN